MGTIEYPFPHKENVVPCSDCAGEVISVGEAVKEFKVGDKVMGNFNQEHLDGDVDEKAANSGLGGALDGVLTEYRMFPEHGLVHMPKHMTYEEASTLPCAAVTAWNSLFGLKPLMPGQTVLLLGTGGVSIFGLQIAAATGAIPIITTSSDEKAQIAKNLGAKHVINYSKVPDWDKEVLRLTNGHGVHHVLEIGGQGTFGKSLASVRLSGVVSLIGYLAQEENVPGVSGITKKITSRAVYTRGVFVGSRRQFLDMNAAFEAHNIKPYVDKVFSFEHAKDAFEYLKTQKHVGKVVISMDKSDG